MMSKKGHMYGVKLSEKMKNGQFKKEYRSNHGADFTGGCEERHRELFRKYLGSCTAILMDERIKTSVKRGYYG